MEEDVLGYIKSARKHGMNDTETKQSLLNAGWDAQTVENSFSHIRVMENQDSMPAKPAEKPGISDDLGKQIRPDNAPDNQTPSLPGSNAILSETSFTAVSSPVPMYKKPLVWILAAIFVVVLGGGGYWYMAYGLNTPQGIWKKFKNLTQSKVYKNKFVFNYSDKGEFDSKDLGSFSLKDLKLTFDGQSYTDIRDQKNPQASAEVQYTFGSGNTNFSTGLKYRIVNRVLFLNVGENPFLDNIFKSLGQGKKVDWLKFDLNALEEQMNNEGADSGKLGKIITDQLKTEISKIWEDSTFVKIDKYAGREKINGVNTVHFKNTLDKQAIKDALNNTLEKIIAAGNATVQSDSEKVRDKDKALAKMVIGGLVDKLEVKNFETWIGVKDFRLYRVKFESNAPSIISTAGLVVSEVLSPAQEKSRDAKRLADIRQMATALELYYNDMEGYPEGKNGTPEGGFAPTYFGVIPTAPAPADGTCTDYYNTYWYESKGAKKTVNGKTVFSDYELTFCLGQDVGGYSGGIAKLTPAGIAANVTCPGDQEKCISAAPKPESQSKTQEQVVREFVDKLKYSAQIIINADYSDFEKSENVEIPGDALDIIEAAKSQVQGLFIKNP